MYYCIVFVIFLNIIYFGFCVECPTCFNDECAQSVVPKVTCTEDAIAALPYNYQEPYDNTDATYACISVNYNNEGDGETYAAKHCILTASTREEEICNEITLQLPDGITASTCVTNIEIPVVDLDPIDDSTEAPSTDDVTTSEIPITTEGICNEVTLELPDGTIAITCVTNIEMPVVDLNPIDDSTEAPSTDDLTTTELPITTDEICNEVTLELPDGTIAITCVTNIEMPVVDLDPIDDSTEAPSTDDLTTTELSITTEGICNEVTLELPDGTIAITCVTNIEMPVVDLDPIDDSTEAPSTDDVTTTELSITTEDICNEVTLQLPDGSIAITCVTNIEIPVVDLDPIDDSTEAPSTDDLSTSEIPISTDKISSTDQPTTDDLGTSEIHISTDEILSTTDDVPMTTEDTITTPEDDGASNISFVTIFTVIVSCVIIIVGIIIITIIYFPK